MFSTDMKYMAQNNGPSQVIQYTTGFAKTGTYIRTYLHIRFMTLKTHNSLCG